jgi:hypothetical protein
MGLDASGRHLVSITFKTDTDEDVFPLSIENVRTLIGELEAVANEAEAQSN